MGSEQVCSNCGARVEPAAASCRACGMPQSYSSQFTVEHASTPRDATGGPKQDASSSARVPGAKSRRSRVLVGAALAVAGAGLAVAVAARRQPTPVEAPVSASEPVASDLARAEHHQPALDPTVQDEDVLPTARFDFHRTRPGYQDSFYVLGEVENTSPYAISKPEVVIVMLGADGKEVATDSGFAQAEILEPGEKSYLSAVVTSPPPHEKLEFEVVPRKATYRPAEAEGLKVIANEPQINSAGIYKFSGRVHNGGERPARFLNVSVLAFDADAKLLSIHFTYAKTDGLRPGEDARFQLTAAGFDAPPARIEYRVSGRVMQ